MLEHTTEVDDEVEEINHKTAIDLSKSPPPIENPKTITKIVEFVEPEPSYQAETFSNVFSSRKETWQKLTSSSTVTAKVEQKCEEFNLKEPIDDNPENSVVDANDEAAEQVDPEDDVEAEIKGQQAGPYDGSYYQLPPSNIPQPTPKAYLTDFHKALLTTPDRPYQIGDIAPTQEPMMHQPDLYEEAIREAEKYPMPEEPPKKPKRVVPKFEVKTNKHDIEFPYTDEEVRRGSLLCSMMRTVSPKPMEFVKSNIIEEVNLPDDSEAYFPPPISMQPNEPYPELDSYRTKSPFVGALTTVPDRPYTPFGREIMSQLSMELPQETRKITFSNALHTAPDDSFDPSSMECEYDPIEYTAKSYEMVAEELGPEDEETASNSSAFARVSSSPMRSFLPTIQPWSVPSAKIPENTYTNSMCCQESAECQVSESRRGSQYQAQADRRRSSVQTQCPCDSERCNQNLKPISELLKTKVREEDEFDPEMPNPKAPYPRRAQAPSPFEGMQVKVTNKMTQGLHKADEIPNYQRKWYNLPTQNPPKTPEPEELRENVPMAFKEWSSRQSSVSRAESPPRHENAREIIAEIAESAKSSKPPIPSDYAYFASSRKTTATEAVTRYIESEEAADEVTEMTFPSSTPSFPCSTGNFPTSTRRCLASPECHDTEEGDDVFEMKFPTTKIIQQEGGFPTRGVRKNSLADLPQRQKVQFERQRDLRHELHSQQQKMQQKHKLRQKIELEAMQSSSSKASETKTSETRISDARASEEAIGQKIQKNQRLSAYEQEQEYKRQIELERMQRQKEQELKEQQAREADYNRRMEISRQHEIKLREKREIDLQQETQRELEYQKIRSEQEEIERRHQEERDLELRREQENIEMELRKQQEREKRMAEAREAQRLFEIRRKEERDRELEKIERELREKREDELRRLEKEVRERREQKQREELEAEKLRCQMLREQEMAAREQKRLEEEAAKVQHEREHKLQLELKWRQKQESDRKQREEMELFNIEEEKRRNEKIAYTTSTYQQSAVWPPTSKPPTPALVQPPRQVPIIKTDSETELNSTRFRFEPLDEEQRRFMAAIRPPSTCYSPATEDKPYPSIPYYQQHLAFYEAEADHCGVFNPKAHSPTPNRSKSPAFGPPPNPLLAFVNKTRDPELDESGIYLCGERLLSPVWYDKHKKQIPAPVQRKIHPLGGSFGPPTKPDISALSAAVRKHRVENAGTKPPPTPPPMPGQKSSPRSEDDVSTAEPCNTPAAIPKGIVASQIRRLSGDGTNSLSVRTSITQSDDAPEAFLPRECDARKTSRQTDFYDETRQTMTNFNASTTSSHHQLTSNSSNIPSQSYHQHLMGQSLASASFQNSQMNQNSVENVRAGSVGQPGAVPKHGRTFTTTGPNRGQGVLTQPSTGRIPICGGCACQVRLVMGSRLSSSCRVCFYHFSVVCF